MHEGRKEETENFREKISTRTGTRAVDLDVVDGDLVAPPAERDLFGTVGHPELELSVHVVDEFRHESFVIRSLEDGKSKSKQVQLRTDILKNLVILVDHGNEERGLRPPIVIDPVPVGNVTELRNERGEVLQHA